MALIWVTGSSGVGKSTVCEALKARGELAADADFEGFSGWVDRESGAVVRKPPYPVPSGWLERYAWRIDRGCVEAWARHAADRRGFLCGSVENEREVWDLFDMVVCLTADDESLRLRLSNRTTNAFGKHPEELAAALVWNATAEATCRGFGASIINGCQPVDDVVEQVLAGVTEELGEDPPR